MSILIPGTYRTYRILILYNDKLENYETVKNDIKFWEKWIESLKIKGLKRELNNRYDIIPKILEFLKKYRGQGYKLKEQMEMGFKTIDLYSYTVNTNMKDVIISIIFSIFNNTNTIVVWGIIHQSGDYNEILKHAKKFMDKNKNNRKLMSELLGNYRILISYKNKLYDYETVRNDEKFWEEWIGDLKKDFNNVHKTILDRLDSLKKLEGQKEKLKNLKNGLLSDRVNKSIRIIFYIDNDTNTIIVSRINYHEPAYRNLI